MWLVCLLIWGSAALAEEPSWRDIKIAVEREDFAQLQTWIKEYGVKHEKACPAFILVA